MRRRHFSLILPATFLSTLSLMFLAGCHDETKQADAQAAEHALGLPTQDEKKTSEVTRDVTVIRETKVIDNKTGKTISDTKEATPVRVTKETQVETDVNTKVGETKATAK